MVQTFIQEVCAMAVDLQSKSGIARMYEEFFPKIYNYVYYRVNNHGVCGDIVSDVFLKVLEHTGSFDPKKASFATWVYAIARNAVIDYYRSQKSSCDIEDYMDTLICSFDFEDAYRRYTEEKNGDIKNLIAILNEREQCVIYMRYFEGCSGKETAKQMQINESTERTLHQRALQKMLQYFGEQGITLDDFFA